MLDIIVSLTAAVCSIGWTSFIHWRTTSQIKALKLDQKTLPPVKASAPALPPAPVIHTPATHAKPKAGVHPCSKCEKPVHKYDVHEHGVICHDCKGKH